MPGVGDAESCNICPTLPLPMHRLTAQGGTGAWVHGGCNEPLFAFRAGPLVFLTALEVSAVVRSEPGGSEAQERPLCCCAVSPREMPWALQGASAAGLQMWGGCCMNGTCALPQHVSAASWLLAMPLSGQRLSQNHRLSGMLLL